MSHLNLSDSPPERCPSPILTKCSRSAILLGALVIAILTFPRTGYSLFVREHAWAPNGPVSAIARSSNTLYIGGNFSLVGPVAGPAVAVQVLADDGSYLIAEAQKPFPRVAGKIRALEPDGSGGWYIGGLFTSVQGQPRNNLAQIDGAGNLTSWNPDANGEVDDIALGSGVVYVGGAFTAVGGAPRDYVAAISTANGTATSWVCHPNGPVTEIERGESLVYLGGAFTAVNGDPHEHLAGVDPTTGSPTFFHYGTGSGITNTDALEFYAGKLLIAVTAFSTYALKAFDEASDSYLPYNVFTDGPIYDITTNPTGSLAFFGGSFSSAAGQPRSNLASIAVSTGELWTGWDIPTDGPVRTVAYYFYEWAGGGFTSGIMVGGAFQSVGGQSRNNVAYLSGGASFVFPWTFACEGDVYALEPDSAMLYIGGDFSIINGVQRSNLAAIDATGGSLLDWSPTTNATVEALTVSGTTVYVGGQFSQVNGTSRNRAASVDALTGALTGFNPNVDVSGPTTVRAFARDGGTLYMAGAFGSVGGVPRVSLAAVDATTGGLSSWNPNVNGAVYAMGIAIPTTLNPPTIVIGGQFTSAGGQPRNNLAALNGGTGLATPWNPNANGYVHSLIVLPTASGGINRVYAGGAFSTMGAQSRNRLAIIDGTGAVTAWNPSLDGLVYAMALSGNTLIAGGGFTSVGGIPRSHIAAIDLTTGSPTSWAPDASGGVPDGQVNALLRVSGTVYAGGTFTRIAGTPQLHFAGISDASVTAVESGPSPEHASPALRAAPNPFDRSTTIRFSLASAGMTQVTIHDVAGRRVRELHEGWLPSGQHVLPWNGRDDLGRTIAAGVYLVRVREPAGYLGSKIYRLK